ncbi:MAG: thioesterase family protein [Rhodanobacteraceae bacterium]
MTGEVEAESLFVRERDLYRPTASAGGPWSAGYQHGGPPLGLLAWAFEREMTRPGFHLARMTTDLLRPTPMRPLSVDIRQVRQGGRLEVLEGCLSAAGEIVTRSTALFLKDAPAPIRPRADDPDPPLPEARGPTIQGINRLHSRKADRQSFAPHGLHTRVEIRLVDGVQDDGRGRAWMRLPMPVVAGEPCSLTVQAAALSDFGNGVGQLRVDAHTGSINADVTLYLSRAPVSEWIGFDACARLSGNGNGLVITDLYDTRGKIGHVVQATLLMPLYRSSTQREIAPAQRGGGFA